MALVGIILVATQPMLRAQDSRTEKERAIAQIEKLGGKVEVDKKRRGMPLSLDDLLWDAFGGNRAMEELLRRYAPRIAFAFCGHTHRERECTWHGIRGYNIGGDYHFKRLLWLDWPAGIVTPHQFGDAVR
jgi:hypothetical protein